MRRALDRLLSREQSPGSDQFLFKVPWVTDSGFEGNTQRQSSRLGEQLRPKRANLRWEVRREPRGAGRTWARGEARRHHPRGPRAWCIHKPPHQAWRAGQTLRGHPKTCNGMPAKGKPREFLVLFRSTLCPFSPSFTDFLVIECSHCRLMSDASSFHV